MRDAVSRYEAARAQVDLLEITILAMKAWFDESVRVYDKRHQPQRRLSRWRAFQRLMRPVIGLYLDAQGDLLIARALLTVREPEGKAA